MKRMETSTFDKITSLTATILINIFLGVVWFSVFPVMEHPHWGHLVEGIPYVVGMLFSLYFFSKYPYNVNYLKIGMVCFLYGFSIKMYGELTTNPPFLVETITLLFSGAGVIMVTIGFLSLFNFTKENLVILGEKEKELMENEEKYRTIFNSLTDIYYRTDENMRITIISPSVKEVGGYDPEEVIGKKAHDFYFNSLERDIFVKQLKEKGYVKDFELKLLTKEGDAIVVSSNVKMFYDNNNQILGLEGVLHDITKRKEMEVALQKANTSLEKNVAARTTELNSVKENLNNIFNNTSDALILADRENNILDMNKSAETLFGFTKEDLINNTEVKLEYYDQSQIETADVLQSLALDGSPQIVEWKGKKKDGTSFDEEVLLNKTEYNEQDVLLITVRDITERKKLEEKAKKQMADLTRFQKVTIGRELKMAELKKRDTRTQKPY